MRETIPAVSGESGNVLFLILIAVVLFAALSFAVTMSGRNESKISDDKFRLAASQIAQSGVDIDTAVLRLRVSHGAGDSEISFEHDLLDDYENPDCAADSCKVFTPTGGQISYNKPNHEWLHHPMQSQPYFGDWLYTGTACVPGLGLGNDQDCASEADHLELLAILPYLNKGICVELNKRLGVPMVNDQPPRINGSAWDGDAKFIGEYSNGNAIIDPANALFGHAEACFEGNGTPPAGSYHYYRVVIRR